ncbi:hypothetical protein [Pseudocitrobacter faecalis]|uniref:hypothetical protein n=1 Tax=Pseudocitrobacter faecalis TaxID=1398493 RepID=UPI0016729710|nr:hypothetical protein [Pseudocitrobacter faecalis]GHD91798.1 hypothetical protein GCM10011445_12530 [Pseudocitrobacter faecalis]
MFFFKNNKTKQCVMPEVVDEIPLQEKRRLYLLENGVKNFSGGVTSLHDRIDEMLRNDCTDTEMLRTLLSDLSIYLRDLQVVGKLKPD